MNESLWIVSICKLHNGWQTPIIFRESEKEKMDKLILDEQLQHNTVDCTLIHGMAVEPLRQFFKDEAMAEALKNKPEITSFEFTPRHPVDVIFNPPNLPHSKDK